MTLSQINNLPNNDLKIWRICREFEDEDSIIKAAGTLGITFRMIKGILAYERCDGSYIEVKPNSSMCHPRVCQVLEV